MAPLQVSGAENRRGGYHCDCGEERVVRVGCEDPIRYTEQGAKSQRESTRQSSEYPPARQQRAARANDQ